eukprot:m.834170 g.834170  ORF g.834170 m.834170 type:complete len:1072 (+) comp23444_c0_seq4:147-3362(+)
MLWFAVFWIALLQVGATSGTPISPTPVELHVAVFLRHDNANLSTLLTALHNVSHPEHPLLGKYWRREDLIALLHPGSKTVDEAKKWLAQILFDADVGKTPECPLGCVSGSCGPDRPISCSEKCARLCGSCCPEPNSSALMYHHLLQQIHEAPTGDLIWTKASVEDVEARFHMRCVRTTGTVRSMRRRGTGKPGRSQHTRIVCRPNTQHAAVLQPVHDIVRYIEAAGDVDGAAGRTAAVRTRKEDASVALTAFPPACQLAGQSAPCGARPGTEIDYAKAQLPQAPASADFLSVAPLPGGSTYNVTGLLTIWPWCFDQLVPSTMPISKTFADGNALLWVDKLANPCGTNAAVSNFSVTFVSSSGDTMTSAGLAPGPNCFSSKKQVCVAGADGSNRSDPSTYSTRTYPYTYCQLAMPNTILSATGRYTIRVAMHLNDSSIHSVFVSTLVPGEGSAASSLQNTTFYASQVKYPNAMRKWYNMSTSDVVNISTRPQAFGILQYPSLSGGSYGATDLNSFLAAAGIQSATTIADNVHFIGVPSVSTNTAASYLHDNVSSFNRSASDTPCRVENNPTPCECGASPVYGGESTLDVQCLTGATQGGSTVAFRSGYWTAHWVAADDYTDTLYTLLDVVWAVLFGDVVPQVLSFSYGMPMGTCAVVENPFGDQNSQAHMVERGDVYFQVLGALGVTVFASSGDMGAHGSCEVPILNGNGGCTGMHPSYPAVSPYVTAVGGTELAPDPANPVPSQRSCRTFGNGTACVVEETISIDGAGAITSGGGFANNSGWSTQPAWQQAHIAAYVNHGYYFTDTRGRYPIQGDGSSFALGRGYPDISAFAGRIGVVLDGTASSSGGTSASSPFLAGVIAVLNSQLQAVGKPYVGFLNPKLYHAAENHPSSFNDITSGNINCRGQTNEGFFICCATGYNARAGWDPATGLGSLNFGNFRAYVMGLSWSSAGPPAPPWTMPTPTTTAPSAMLCPVAATPYLGVCASNGGSGGSGNTIGVVLGVLFGLGATAVALLLWYKRCLPGKAGAYRKVQTQELDAMDDEQAHSDIDAEDEGSIPGSAEVLNGSDEEP